MLLLMDGRFKFSGTTPQLSVPQGKSLYATMLLAVFEAAFLVPG